MLTDAQTEFGGTNPIDLNEYYAGGGLVPSGATGTNGKDTKDTSKALKKGFKIFRYWESTVKKLGIDNIVEDIVKLEGKHCRILKEP